MLDPRAGVVEPEDLVVAGAGGCHVLGTELAQADAVAEALAGDDDAVGGDGVDRVAGESHVG